MRLLWEPRRWFGYTDMGRITIPPMPDGIVMTDRADGTLWLLSHSGAAVALTSPVPARWRGVPVGPYDGPYLRSPLGLLRLFVSGGILQYELAPEKDQGRQPNRVLTRNFAENKTTYELTAGAVVALGDPLTLTQVL